MGRFVADPPNASASERTTPENNKSGNTYACDACLSEDLKLQFTTNAKGVRRVRWNCRKCGAEGWDPA